MKKIFKYICLFIFNFTLFTSYVFAESFDASVNSNVVTVGETITLTISGSNMAGKFSISTSNDSLSLSVASVFIDNNSENVTIYTKEAGTYNIKVTADDVTSYSGESITGSKTISVTVKEKPSPSPSQSSAGNSGNQSNSNTKPKTNTTTVAPKVEKSSNNYLSSLQVEGFPLDKEFNKDTLEYTLNLTEDIDKIKVEAKAENDKAKVEGAGEIELADKTKLEIVVTAENGTTKTYVINISKNNLNDFTVEIDDVKYKVISDDSDTDMTIPEGYTKEKIKIDNNDVLAYYNKNSKYTLVILENEKGEKDFYTYNNGKYSLYKEYNFSGVRLRLLNKAKPDNFIIKEVKYDKDKITVYQLDPNATNVTYAIDGDLTDYYLVYAMNIDTGREGYYLLDLVENTAIRYTNELGNLFLDKQSDKNYKVYFFIALAAFGALALTMGIILIINSKKKNKNAY